MDKWPPGIRARGVNGADNRGMEAYLWWWDTSSSWLWWQFVNIYRIIYNIYANYMQKCFKKRRMNEVSEHRKEHDFFDGDRERFWVRMMSSRLPGREKTREALNGVFTACTRKRSIRSGHSTDCTCVCMCVCEGK